MRVSLIVDVVMTCRDVAHSTGLKVIVTLVQHSYFSSAVKLTKRPVSSKGSDSKTRSVVAAIRAPALRIILSKPLSLCFYDFFTL